MRRFILFLFALFISGLSYGQVTVTGCTGAGNGSYTTLAAATSAIVAAQPSANVLISITANTTEPVGGATLVAGTWTSLTIQPSGGSWTISGATTAGTPLLILNGSDNVTINGGGNLTFSNTTSSTTSGTSTLKLIADATNNTFNNVTFLGSGKNGTLGSNTGNVWISTGTTTGNDNNSFQSCKFGPAGTNYPNQCVIANGSTTNATIANSNITFNNCEFYDFFATSGSAGIYAGSGNTDWNISNNKIYQTASRTAITGPFYGIYFSSSTYGNNNSITGNTIGYASNTQTGTLTLTTTSTFVGIHIGVGTATTTSVQNNTIAGISISGSTSGTTNSAPFRGIFVSTGLTNIGDVTGNTIGSMTTTGSITFTSSSISTSDIVGIYNYGSSNWITNNNNIGGITGSNSSTGAVNIYGLRCYTGSGVTWTCNNNNIGGAIANSINSTSTATGTIVNGISNTAPAGTFTGNTIRNMTAAGGTGTGTSASVVGIHTSAASSANHTIMSNTIYGLSNTNATSAVTVTGIMFGSSTGTNLISRNLIYGLNAVSSSGSATLNGISINSGTATYQNNVIRLGLDASGGNITAGVIINGINETVAGTDNFYNNSIYIGGNGVLGSASTYAINSAITTNTRKYQNNIFYNARSNSSGTGKHYAVKVGGTAPNPAGLTINYNDYLVTGTGGTFGFFNSLDVASIAAWKTAVGQDANSINADPLFVAATAATPNLNLSTGSPCESVGLAIGTITDDYTGASRAGLTPTDMGAYAGLFAPAGIDMKPTAIVSPAASGCYSTTETVTVTIQNNAGSIIDFTLNPVTVSVAGTNAAAGYNSNTVVNTGTLGIGATMNVNMPATINMTTNGTYSFDATTTVTGDINTGNDALATVSRTVSAMGGTYTVGATGTYSSLTAAVAAYNASTCLTGAVVFSLLDASYSAGETFPITINAHVSASATNTLTIKPAAGVTATISGSNATALLKLNGADYVTIDGSNNGTTTKDLTLSNTIATSSSVIMLSSLGANTGATYNTIKNCNIKSGSITNTTSYGIVIGGATVASTGADNDNNTIQNNTITKAYVAIWAQGSATSNPGLMDNLSVTGNTIGSATATDYISHDGVMLANATGASVSQNTIFNIIISGSTPVGITFGAGVISSSITRNNINNITATGTSGYGGRGIYVSTGNAASSLTISNNLISSIGGDGWTAFSNSSMVGIYLDGTTGGLNIYHNSVYLSGTFTKASATLTTAILLNTATITNVDLRNNIFVNTMDNSSVATDKNYAIYSTSPNTAFSNINYNNYYVSGAQGVLGYIGSDRTDLAGIVTGFGGNANSVNVDPVFTSTPVILTPTVAALDGTGVNGLVAVDYSNVARSNPPDIGALEFTPPSCNIPTALSYTGVTNNQATLNWTAASPAPGSGYDIYYSTSATAPDGATIPTGTVAAGIVTYTTPATLTAQTTYYAWVRSNCGAGLTSNWTSSVTFTTTCDAVSSFPWTESFDGATFVPTCWSNTTVALSLLWARSTAGTYPTCTPHSGAGMAYYNSYSNSGAETMLVTPPLNLSSSADVSFWMYRDPGYSSNADLVRVYYNTSPNKTGATLLGTVNRYLGSSPVVSSAGWYQYTYTVPANSNMYIIFDGVSTAGNNMFLDDINVSLATPMTYTSSTTTQGVVTSVNAGTTDQQVIGIQVVTTGSASPLSLTKLSVNATGSTLESNITNAKIYYTGNSSTFATTNQFGSTLAAPTLANFDVTGTQTLGLGTNYFWLTYDIPSTAINGNVIDAQCTGLTISTVDYVPTITVPAGTRTIVNKTITSITGTQASTVNVLPSQTDKEVLKLTVVAAGPATGSLLLNSINVNYTGTATSDIPATGVKLYATNPNTFATTTPIGTAQSLSAGVATFNTLNYNIPTGTSYLWVAFDVAPTATLGNSVDAKILANGINVGGTTYNGTDIDPAGVRPIGDKVVNSVTITQASTSNITKGTNNNEVLMIDVDVTGTGGLLYLNSIIANYTGTVATDIAASGVKLYRTSTPTFATTNLLGTAQSLVASAATFSTLNYDLPIGHTYVWVTFDVPTTANGYNNVDASILLNNINIGGATYPAASQAPAGNRPILPMVKPLPYIENFNAALTLPIDWLSSPAMTVSATHGNSSSNGLYKNLYSSATSCNAITPPVGVIVAGTQLDFDYRIVDYTGYPATATTLGAGDNVDILVSTDGVTYNSIASINNGNHVSSTAFLTKTYSLAAYIGQTIYVKFAATWATGDYYLDIDNVSIYSPSNMVYTSSTTTQGVVSNVNAGTTSQQVVGIQVVTTNNLSPINITKFALNATGTTNVADITNAKLWSTGASATFATTTQFGSTIAAPTTANFDITGSLVLSQGINYFWLTYDVPTTATNANVIDAQCTGLTVDGTDYIPTVTAPAGTRTIVNKTATITITQAATTDVVSGATGKDIIRIQFNVAGPATGTLNLNSLKVTSLNTSDADIAASGVKLYNTLTSNTFATTTQLGTSQTFAAASATFSGLNYNLPTGNTYIWVAYDIAPTATLNNTVDAKIVANDINVGGTTYPATDQSPAGLRTIKAPLTGIVTVGTAGNYPTLTNTGGIFEAINTYGLSGNLTINIISDLTEPGTVGLNNITETGAGGYTVTIQPSAAVNRTISGNYAGALIRFSGADRVTINGNFGGSGQYLTFSNTNTGSSNNTIAYSLNANNNTIKNCKIYSKYRSITTTAADNTLIEGNDIYGDVAGNSTYSQAGIYVTSTSINTKIRKNTIHDFYYTGTAGWGCYGIYYGAEATTVTEISNNVIYSIKGDGDIGTGLLYNPSGIYISSGGNIQIYYNSINLTGAVLGAGYNAIASGITINSSVTLLDIKNNVISNSMTLKPASTKAATTYSIYSLSANTAFSAINYNDYYVTGASPNIGYISSNRANLAAWQTATSQDAASISADPLFTSATNLLQTTGSPLAYAGVNIAAVTTSINGVTRTNPSDIGAYQVSVCPATSIFTGTGNWSDVARWNNGVPGPCTQVTISGACTMTSNGLCNTLTINPANSLTVNVGQTLSISGQFTIKSTAAGTGSFIDNGTVNYTIPVKVERYLSASKWHLVSSPITSALSGIYVNIWLRAYLEATNTYGAYITPLTIPMPTGQGFSVWANANETRIYSGTLNTGALGPFSAQLTGAASAATGWNLVGNPYPSAIDWNAATGWTKTNIGSTIYLWNSTQYATYNGVVGTNGGSQYIAPEQGFFVQATAGGANFSINNNARLHNPVGFMKTEPANVIRVKITNNEFSDEAVVMFDADASDDYDFKIDAAKLRGGSDAPQMFLKKSDTVETAICGYNEVQKVVGKYIYLEPVNFTSHTFRYSQTVQGNMVPLIIDRVNQTIIYPDVPYVFTPAAGDPINRFQFIEPSGNGLEANDNSTVMVWESANKLFIDHLNDASISNIKVYDMEGRLVFVGNQTVTDLNHLSRAMYLVKVTTDKETVVKKIMIK